MEISSRVGTVANMETQKFDYFFLSSKLNFDFYFD